MDFVNYSLGKKLQEKGYPHGYNRFGYRPIYSDEYTIRYLWDTGAYDEEYYGENIPCPTINEVLTWLRKEKKIHIIIPATFNEKYWWEIRDFKRELSDYTADEYDSFEQAALYGIDYVLDNLI